MTVSVMTLVGMLLSWSMYLFWKRQNVGGMPAPPLFRLILLGLLNMGWFLVTALSTFGMHAPGHALGNLFLGVWICFGLTTSLFKNALRDYTSSSDGRTKAWAFKNKSNRKMLEPSSGKKKNGHPGLIEEDTDEEAPPEFETSNPTRSTDRTRSNSSRKEAATPELVTPRSAHSTSSYRSKGRNVIAVSLEQEFGVEKDDPGMEIRKSSTDRTADIDDEEDFLGTPYRGSATPGAKTPNTGYGTCKSNLTDEAGEKRVTPVPYRSADVTTEYEEDYEDVDMNITSMSAVTTAIDNTSGNKGRDILIDPEDF